MAFSKKLDERRDKIKALVMELKKSFKYVSILGVDNKAITYRVERGQQFIDDGSDTDFGFVVKMTNGASFFEYSLDDVSDDVKELAQKILSSIKIEDDAKKRMISSNIPEDEILIKSFMRESDLHDYSDQDLLGFCNDLRDKLLKKSKYLLNTIAVLETLDFSKIFVTENKMLDQNYCYNIAKLVAVYNNHNKLVVTRKAVDSKDISTIMHELPPLMDSLVDIAEHLTLAKPIVPGYYEVITDPTITGLIAHEAFGHGVEMDQFVKDRALGKHFINKQVASTICNMKDGASAGDNISSYFFDDDGVLAQSTQIIKNGILVSGMSDLVSANELNTVPTGNGRRESHKRKAYSRMTNTFFEKGSDKLEDMIKSIKHGYLLFDTNNGMEDPKNWAIQCACEYGIEIIEGKLTKNYVSPVVMSGYVPDLLKSISMISDDFKLEGTGHCGKGYKEWVRVSDGGPALKAMVKLG